MQIQRVRKEFQVTIAFAVVFAILAGCSAPTSPTRTSRLRDLAANKNAKNVALIFGAENDLTGVSTDVQGVAQLFHNPDFGFQVSVKDHATSSDFINESARVAAMLNEDSTLFWYYSGHGTEEGALFAEDQQLVYMQDVVNAMRKSRNTPFKRVIFVIDSCFSGQNVNGNSAILSDQSQQSANIHAVDSIHATLNQSTSSAPANANGSYPFEQAVVIGAAKKNETSLDGGSQYGGIFTYSWRQTIAKLLPQKNVTLRDMLDQTVQASVNNAGEAQHTPVYRAAPDNILNEPLMGPGTGTGIPDTSFHAYVALTGTDQQVPSMQVSVPQNVGANTMIFCAGDLTACRQNNGQFNLATFVIDPKVVIQDRVIFASQDGISLQSGTNYSMIFRNASGVEVGNQVIRVTSNQ